jgi:predicted DNA-binding transcriptional regulator AlpA
MDEYISVKTLSERIGYKVQSIYNMIHKGTFVLNKHYLKPTPKKILFKWTAVKQWLEGPNPQIVEPTISKINCGSSHDIDRSKSANENFPQNNINI